MATINPTTGAATPLTATGLLKDPRDLEVDAADPTALWVTNTGGSSVVRIARTGGAQLGSPLTGLTQPYGLAPTRRPRVYVANTYKAGTAGQIGSVKAFNRNGSVAWEKTGCTTGPDLQMNGYAYIAFK